MKEYSQSALNKCTKKELINIVSCLQKNNKAMEERLNQQAKNFLDIFGQKNNWKQFSIKEVPKNKNILVRFHDGRIAVGSCHGSNFGVNAQKGEWKIVEHMQILEWRELDEGDGFSASEKELFLERLDVTLDYKTLHEKNYGLGKYSLMDIIKNCLEGKEI